MPLDLPAKWVTRPTWAARVIVLGALCLLPRHDNDPDGNPTNSASVLLSEVKEAVARRR